jgi:2-amino-4-hydroxy-6-hydroxymethyldihydropteridine diphosphokinase
MILIALGANLDSTVGPPQATLSHALAAMPAHGIEVVKVSAFYQTPAWPDTSDPPFVNAVAEVRTHLDPGALLATLHRIEAGYGRTRTVPNAPRTLDLDLLDYDGRVEQGPPVLPHPAIAARAFVLVPLADVAPGWIHPENGRNVSQMLSAFDPAECAKIRRLGW